MIKLKISCSKLSLLSCLHKIINNLPNIKDFLSVENMNLVAVVTNKSYVSQGKSYIIEYHLK